MTDDPNGGFLVPEHLLPDEPHMMTAIRLAASESQVRLLSRRSERYTPVIEAAREWSDARAACMVYVMPDNFDRLARAETALQVAIKAIPVLQDGIVLTRASVASPGECIDATARATKPDP